MAWVAVIAALVGGLIGGFMALTSVLIQNFFLARRQREQLLHDAKERRTEREMALRREVYLEVAGATANLQEYLLQLGNPNATPEQHAEITKGSSAALNRAQVIGTIQTLISLNQAQEFFAESSIDLNLKSLAVKLAALNVSSLEKEADFLFTNRVEFTKMALTQTEPDLKQALEKLVEGVQVKENEIKERVDDARTAHLEELKTLFVASLTAGLAYNNLLIEPLISARRELGLEINAEAYGQMSVAINARLQQKLEASVKSMERLFETP